MRFFDRFFKIVSGRVPLRFYNTLTGQLDVFELPAGVRHVRMYNCGPTVYNTSHVGNLRSYVFADLVRRALEYNGFQVKQVINITDFGHLSSDNDLGNDKMSMALKREGLELSLENMRSLAERYAREFFRDLALLNIPVDRITFPRASDFIAGEIALAQTLEEKGYAYRAEDGLYFDTSRFPSYGQLGNIDIAGLREGARVAAASDKRHLTDFLLWKKDTSLGWESPWGRGFPGWHIECSAMVSATLGKQIDIHTGGIDLLPTHHNNEIAQSESATGKHPFSRFWMHHAFLNINSERIAKSAGNMINLSDLMGKGFRPLAYRYFLLGAHYKTPMDFTWEALEAAHNALARLYEYYSGTHTEGHDDASVYLRRFHERINDDLDTPGALAVMWEMTRDDKVSFASKMGAIRKFDAVLGLDIAQHIGLKLEIPAEVQRLVAEREQARASSNFTRADLVRSELMTLGYTVEDRDDGPRVKRLNSPPQN